MSIRRNQDLRDLLSTVRMMITDQPMPVGLEGIAVTGSGNPQNSTVEVIRGDTYASLSESIGSQDPSGNTLTTTQNLSIPNVSLATTQHGDQWTPEGGERTVLIPVQGGYIAIFEHSTDDSPQAPPGWRYITKIKGFKLQTRAGMTITCDDAAQTITIQTAGGLKLVANDATGIMSVGNTGLDNTLDAAITVRDFNAWISSEYAHHIHSGVQGGSGTSGSPTTATTPTGSSKVKIAP